MALTNTEALCLLTDLKDDLGITDSSSDARLERRILAASSMITEFLNRPLRYDAARVEALPGYGTDKLFPSLTPIRSITSVTFEDELLDPDTYEIDPHGLFVVAESGWLDTRLGVQTIASKLQRIAGTEQPLFIVTFAGGYSLPNDSVPVVGASLPPLISEACLQLAASLHLSRGSDRNVQGESVGAASIQYRVSYDGDGSMNGIPKNIAAMLAPFRRAV